MLKRWISILLGLLLLIPLLIFLVKKLVPPRIPSGPPTYSVIQFNPNAQQLLPYGARLIGRGIPNAKVVLFFTKGEVRESAVTDKRGNWSFTLPLNVKGNLLLTVEMLDKNGAIASITSFPLSIASEEKDMSNGTQSSFAKYVHAQEDQFTGPSYAKWITSLQSADVFPIVENGELVFYDESHFKEKYCSASPCLFPRPLPAQEIGKQFRSKNVGFLKALVQELERNNYAPLPVLEPLLPGVGREMLYSELGLTMAYPVGAKTQINNDELGNIITNVHKRYLEKIEYEERGGFAGLLIDLGEPFFATRSILNLITLPKNQRTEEDLFNALVGLSLFLMPEKVLLKGEIEVAALAAKTLHIEQAAKDTKAFMQALKKGPLPLGVVKSRIAHWISPSKSGFIRQPVIDFTLRPRLIFGEAYKMSLLKRLFERRDAYVFDPVVSRAMMEDLIDNLSFFEHKSLKKPLNIKTYKTRILETISNNWVVIVKDAPAEAIGLIKPGSGGYAAGQLVVIRESQARNPAVFYHEFIHVVSHAVNPTGQGKFFLYDKEQADLYGETMSILYELLTDDIAEVLGYQTVYKHHYPQLYDNSRRLISHIMARSGGRILYSDFLQFALTMDDRVFIRNLLQFMTPQQFMNVLETRINIHLLNTIAQEQRKYTPLVVAGTAGIVVGEAILLNEFFTRLARGDEIPQDSQILNLPFTDDVDGVFKDVPDEADEVTITQVRGDLSRGSQLEVSVLITEDGSIVNVPRYTVNFSIQPASPEESQGGVVKSVFSQESSGEEEFPTSITGINILAQCHQDEPCRIPIPSNLRLEKFKLIALLTNGDSPTVLDGDSIVLALNTSVSPQPTHPQITTQPTRVPSPTLPPHEFSVPGYSIAVPGFIPIGGLSTLRKIIQVGVGLLIIVAIILALISLLWGGLQWITSEGDKQKLQKARSTLIFAIVGLIIVFLSFLIIHVIGYFFNVNLLDF